jgi:hypothetical protein
LLAVLSRGDALVVATLLALAAWRPLPVAALGAALVASSWRWGSTSLEALAGAQAVLGPAGWVGPTAAALSSWLAGVAVLLGATRALPEAAERQRARHDAALDLEHEAGRLELGGRERRWSTSTAATPSGGRWGGASAVTDPQGLGAVALAVAAGATAAAVVAGPAPGGALLARIVATVLAAALALAVASARARDRRTALVLDVVAVVAAGAALATAAMEAGAWSGTVSGDALREGVAVALAAAALVAVSARGATAMGARRA